MSQIGYKLSCWHWETQALNQCLLFLNTAEIEEELVYDSTIFYMTFSWPLPTYYILEEYINFDELDQCLFYLSTLTTLDSSDISVCSYLMNETFIAISNFKEEIDRENTSANQKVLL